VIECPICHVQNDDRSLFCAECGQRFAPTPGQAVQQQSQSPPVTPEETPKRPPMKLRSPILGEPEEEPDQELGRMRPFGKSADSSSAIRPKGRMRSPGLGEHPDEEESPPSSAGGPIARRGLRSPLLHSGTDEPDEPETSSGSGMFPHRSNSRLNAPPPEGAPPAGTKPKSLRSPLLGGDPGFDEVDIEEEEIQTKSGRGKRLRSPVFGDAVGQFEDDYEPPQLDEDPNALRSPLLARRVKPEPAGQPKGATPQPAGAAPRIEPVVSANPAFGGNVPPATPPPPQPIPQSVSPAPGTNMPAPYSGNPPSMQGFNPTSYGLGTPTASAAPQLDYSPTASNSNMSSIDRSTIPTGYQGNATWPIPAQPGAVSPNPVSPPLPPAGPPKILPPASGAAAVTESARSYGAPPPAPTPQSRSESRFDSDTESGARSGKSDVQYGEALPPRAGRAASRSKFLPNTDGTAGPIERYESPQPRKHLGFARFMLFPLLCAVGFKVWYLIAMGPTALQSMPFLGDQVSQLVVIVCLMIFTFLATSE